MRKMKIDIHTVPVLCLLYLRSVSEPEVSFTLVSYKWIRMKIVNAAVSGMIEELGLVGNKYNTALVILFV